MVLALRASLEDDKSSIPKSNKIQDAVTKRVTGQTRRKSVYRNAANCVPPEPLRAPPWCLQSEHSPHTVVSWRPGRHLDIQLLTSSQIKSTSPPCLSPPSHPIAIPCTEEPFLDKSISDSLKRTPFAFASNRLHSLLAQVSVCHLVLILASSDLTRDQTVPSNPIWLHDPLCTALLYHNGCYEILIVGSAYHCLAAVCRPFLPASRRPY